MTSSSQQPTLQPERIFPFWELIWGGIVEPTLTLRRIKKQQPVSWAIGIIIVLSLLHGASSPLAAWLNPVNIETQVTSRLLLAGFGFVGFLLWIWFIHRLALWLNGQGSYTSLLCGVAFLMVAPDLVSLILQAGFEKTLEFALGLWGTILSVLAVRENYLLSIGSAITALLISALIVLLVAVAVLVALWMLPGDIAK